ncbi:MAG: DNA starvation/stationary phase protection protein Dps [Planctomycetaceae bacterium]|nr:DNA starvation/stationary phase protection protein Dps [Planctomycetaceae bacterium]
MHRTRNDMEEPLRKKMVSVLNARLADLIDLKLQTKQAHWNVKGPSFFSLHQLFDQFAETLDEHVDNVAERVVALGGVALGTVEAVAEWSELPEYPSDISSGSAHVTALCTSVMQAAKTVRADIDISADAGDAGTADLLTGVSRDLDKYLWFLESHTQADS